MTPHDEVLAVNEAFYRAFRERDLAAMEALWARHHPVACVHPGWRALAGRVLVLGSWQAIFDNPRSPRVEARHATAFVQGDSAFVICAEVLDEGALVATNLFVREEGAWRLVHHHAGPGEPLEGADEEPPDFLH